MNRIKIEAVVIGVSAGGMEALRKIIPELPPDYPIPIIVVQHLHPSSDDFMAQDLDKRCSLKVKQADEKEQIRSGYVYIAPPNYHLLIEKDRTFSLSVSDLVNYARPAIDVLFESASDVYRDRLACIVLTGANKDGTSGAKRIKENGGIVIAQDPETAEVETMPKSVIDAGMVDLILPLDKIADFLKDLAIDQ